MRKDLNQALKEHELAEKSAAASAADGTVSLDDVQRVKVLSPSKLVFKRFVRNKLAIIGFFVLLFMFLFAFVGPVLYRFGQTEVFYKYADAISDYASVYYRTEFTAYTADESIDVHYTIKNMLNSYVTEMQESGAKCVVVSDEDGNDFAIRRKGESIYTIDSVQLAPVGSVYTSLPIGSYSSLVKAFTYLEEPLDEGFEAAVADAVKAKADSFEYNGEEYAIKAGKTKGTYNVTQTSGGKVTLDGFEDAAFSDAASDGVETGVFSYGGSEYMLVQDASDADLLSIERVDGSKTAIVGSNLVFDAVEIGGEFSPEFRIGAFTSMYTDKAFTADGVDYTIKADDNDEFEIYTGDTLVAHATDFVARRYSGDDTLPLDFKIAIEGKINEMLAAGEQESTFVTEALQYNDDGTMKLDENGQMIFESTEFEVTLKTGQYVLRTIQNRYLIDIYAGPTTTHWFGTDHNGMDVLARMMYGGRVSLLVGFIVVFIEILLGVIMGGIAGYFGGWVDNLIMRLVDIFYCIPSMPLLIIFGAMMDALKMDSYVRLMYLMVILGVLGWAGVARLVRGQILSLREQEFMIATEATGIKTSRRIFRHLVPNVMPQLIVTATMGLGSVILTESTLSFLGLGVKHPLATWGTMINSVSDAASMINYTYIWIPVGVLICLTVIAFNFVGDGLRDAFDPKMKR